MKLQYNDNLSKHLGLMFAQMEFVRSKLLERVCNYDLATLDFTPDDRKVETIATSLYHIAAVEYSWIFEDIFGEDMDFEEWKHGFALRSGIDIDQIKGREISFYLDKLSELRSKVFEKLSTLDDRDMKREITVDGEVFDIEWILFHVMEHEMQHLGQIILTERLYRLQK
ncbi:MAG: DinB family protein [Candidatus Heimdallarchaeota archaeon]|nr:DinB family protein [Candidatus Heimdallarchaeota archaeon]